MNKRRRALRGVAIAWLAGFAVVGAGGCSASARSTAPSASTAPHASAAPSPAFERAKAECTHQAAEATREMVPQGVASKAAVGIYVECMRGKGFSVGKESN